MMKKYVLLICLCLVLAGCKGEGGGFKMFSRFKTQPSAIETEVHVGSEGLKMEFLEDQPPKEIREGELFIIGIDLRNVGASPINKGWVLLQYVGISDEMKITDKPLKKPIKQLKGKEFGNIEGGRTIIDYTVTNINVPRDQKSRFKAEACYEYETTASMPICINPQVGGMIAIGGGGCTVREVKSSGQGAPIVVSKVRPTVTRRPSEKPGDERVIVMRLEIEVDNKGKGQVVEFLEGDVCGGKPRIKVGSVTISQKDLVSTGKCSGLKDGNFLELGKKEEDNTFTCEFELVPAQGSYITPLIIELSYAYSQTKEIEIRVKER